MWKKVLMCTLVLAFISCGTSRKVGDSSKESKNIVLGKTPVVSYKSLGNGVASISLVFFENNTFAFDFKSIPQPETDEKQVKISEKGTYVSEGAWKNLNFKDPKFSLAAIFDTDFATGTEFKVIDEENVMVNTSKESLSIWDVVCEKK